MSAAIVIEGYNQPAPSVAPTVTPYTGTLIGNLTIGAVYQYVYTYVTAFGETIASPIGSATATSTATMSLTIPVAASNNVFQRNLYRTAGNGSTFYNLSPIQDNLTTTYLDSTADYNLGSVNPPRYSTADSIGMFQGRVLMSPFPTMYSITTGITAHAGGGQTLAVPLTTEYNFISVAATTSDSVMLPNITTNFIGMHCVVYNGGASTVAVFPAAGQNAGGGINTAVAVTAGVSAEWIATTSTVWTKIR